MLWLSVVETFMHNFEARRVLEVRQVEHWPLWPLLLSHKDDFIWQIRLFLLLTFCGKQIAQFFLVVAMESAELLTNVLLSLLRVF